MANIIMRLISNSVIYEIPQSHEFQRLIIVEWNMSSFSWPTVNEITSYSQYYSDELVQERRNSSALAMQLRLSCTNTSICYIPMTLLHMTVTSHELYQSIEINNNTHVYHQCQLRKPVGSGVEWAECSLMIGTGCRIQVVELDPR